MPRSGLSATERAELQAFAGDLFSDAQLTRVTSLHGGLSARMQRLDVVVAGARRSIVLRRYNADFRQSSVERTANEFRVLRLLAAAGMPVPQALWLDAEGNRFGQPSMALEYLRGGIDVLLPPSRARFIETARVLKQIHSITAQSEDLSFLGSRGRARLEPLVAKTSERANDSDGLVRRVADALRAGIEGIEWLPECLVHGDFWPGNIIWSRGHIRGVIDWTFAARGDPRGDIAQHRLDLALIHGLDAADAFLNACREAYAPGLEDIAFFDLERGHDALNSIAVHEEWLKGYHDLKLTSITPEILRSRLEVFIDSALSCVERR